MRAFSLVAARGGYSLLWCVGFSLQWLLLLWSTGSRHTGFSSCGAQALLLCSIWDLPGPGLEPVSPALSGRSLTTVPPGESLYFILHLGFYRIPSFGTYSSVASLCLICCFYFYVFSKLVKFLNLGEVTFCRRCPMCPSRALLSDHQSYMF